MTVSDCHSSAKAVSAGTHMQNFRLSTHMLQRYMQAKFCFYSQFAAKN